MGGGVRRGRNIGASGLGRGQIQFKQFKQQCRNLTLKDPSKVIRQAFDYLDVERRGLLGYKEFGRIFTNPLLKEVSYTV